MSYILVCTLGYSEINLAPVMAVPKLCLVNYCHGAYAQGMFMVNVCNSIDSLGSLSYIVSTKQSEILTKETFSSLQIISSVFTNSGKAYDDSNNHTYHCTDQEGDEDA